MLYKFVFFSAFVLLFSCKSEPKKVASVVQNEKWEIGPTYDLGDYETFGVAQFKEFLFLTDTLNKVLLCFNTQTKVLDTICQRKAAYLNCTSARLTYIDMETDSVFVYRGSDPYSIPVSSDIDGPKCMAGRRIDNFVIVSDEKVTYNKSGNFSTIGSKGSEMGQFEDPCKAIFIQDQIYITDTGNSRVQVFDLDGVFQFSFGEEILNGPTDMSYDNAQVYICDKGNKSIAVFTHTGNYLYSMNANLVDPISVSCVGKTLIVGDVGDAEIKSFNKVF